MSVFFRPVSVCLCVCVDVQSHWFKCLSQISNGDWLLNRKCWIKNRNLLRMDVKERLLTSFGRANLFACGQRAPWLHPLVQIEFARKWLICSLSFYQKRKGKTNRPLLEANSEFHNLYPINTRWSSRNCVLFPWKYPCLDQNRFETTITLISVIQNMAKHLFYTHINSIINFNYFVHWSINVGQVP